MSTHPFKIKALESRTLYVSTSANAQGSNILTFREHLFADSLYVKRKELLQKMKQVGDLMRQHEGTFIDKDLSEQINNILQ